jgi:hypothetical protein
LDGVMPKNIIGLGKNSVAVGWSKDAPVAQIGVCSYDDDGAATSLWIDFTERGQLNSLIRSLRQARDGAYGPDA